MKFNFQTRQETLSNIESTKFDLAIIGGGITGAGIFRDAVLRGLKTVLIEQSDFASGTSGRSSQLVHGGLRYLEQFKFGLVYESVRERGLLMKLFPHLVRPLKFVFPVYSSDSHSLGFINLGLIMYDFLAVGRNYKAHSLHYKKKILQEEATLNDIGLKGGVSYYDCSTDDARLTLANIISGVEAGGVALSYFGFEKPMEIKDDNKKLVCKDKIDGQSYVINATTVINAAGVWTDNVLSMYEKHDKPMLRPTQGIHLVVSRAKLPVKNAVAMMALSDKRATFVVPWEETVYIGTTDVDFNMSHDKQTIDKAQINYLLETVNHYFPNARLTNKDIISAWTGLRPLLHDDNDSPYSTSREHFILDFKNGILFIAGGKLTTYRKMAEEIVDKVILFLKSEHIKTNIKSCVTKKTIPSCASGLTTQNIADFTKEIARKYGLESDIATHLVNAYGKGAHLVATMSPKDLNKRIVDDLPYIEAEISYCVENEIVLSLEDFLKRRTRIFLKSLKLNESIVISIIDRMGDMLNWDDEQKQRELAWFQKEKQLFRQL